VKQPEARAEPSERRTPARGRRARRPDVGPGWRDPEIDRWETDGGAPGRPSASRPATTLLAERGAVAPRDLAARGK
jgi:hypothetical protein